MPPKTRGNKTSKASKENIGVNCKTKTKTASKVPKPPRKALADKTNSASDDNASFLKSKPSAKIGNETNLLVKQRPRRERRLPKRYVEIENISNCKDVSVEISGNSKQTPIKRTPIVVLSPLKTPIISLDSSLTAKRPKRICRLPSKFDDHSISPSKFVPVQAAYTSTPKVLKKPKEIEKNDPSKKREAKKALTSNKVVSTKVNPKKTVNKKNNDTSKPNSPNSSADTNNNAKTDPLPRSKTKNKQDTPPKVSVPNPKVVASKKPVNKNVSIRILDDRKNSLKRDASNFDVYEFTYDPNEEPPPQKKKRRKPAKKREPKPKMVVFKDNYDRNLAKTLKNLKSTISAKSVKPIIQTDNVNHGVETLTAHPAVDTVVTTVTTQPMPSNKSVTTQPMPSNPSVTTQPMPSNPCNSDKSHTSVKNYNSVRVEDIALDFEEDSFVDDINYSPAHTVCQPTTPATNTDNVVQESHAPTNEPMNTPARQNNNSGLLKPIMIHENANNDPLNLREDLSFFDDQPVASSSMNVSTRNPAASPWRVEFGRLPIKWQVNTYVKPNMTPAFDSSFMNFNESNKKHVYTNMVTESNEENDVPHIYEDYASKLKQTSIISFIKEVVESKAKKRKEKMTPIKANSHFEDPKNTPIKDTLLAQNDHMTPKKNAQTNIEPNDQNTPSSVSNVSNENEVSNNSEETEKENSKESAKSSSKKKRNKNVSYFGFDETENVDQENVSPVKKIDKRILRALKPRSRAVLQEINEQKGPTRAVLPVAVKSKPVQNSERANSLFDQMKSATEPPVFPDKDPIQNPEITNITETQSNVALNDDQSVHLFEDLEFIHHLKAHRKSYGKAKKAVTFRQNSVSDSDVPPSDVAEQSASSDEDDSLDLTFKVPAVQPKKTARKKKPKKNKISKKEEREVEAWAAGFNSMCEDIEEFDLVVE